MLIWWRKKSRHRKLGPASAAKAGICSVPVSPLFTLVILLPYWPLRPNHASSVLRMPRAHLLLMFFQDVLSASHPLLLPNCYFTFRSQLIQCVLESPHQGQGSLPGTLMTLPSTTPIMGLFKWLVYGSASSKNVNLARAETFFLSFWFILECHWLKMLW